jgi:hypothetical protein
MNAEGTAPVIKSEENGVREEPTRAVDQRQVIYDDPLEQLDPPQADKRVELDLPPKHADTNAPSSTREDAPSSQQQQHDNVCSPPLSTAPTSDLVPTDSYNNDNDFSQDAEAIMPIIPKDLSSLPFLGALHFPKKDLPLNCVVLNCGKSLNHHAEYYQRYRICKEHLLSSMINIGTAGPHRFCQQCGKFEHITCFDGEKRNCRVRLRKHNDRRRQQKQMMEDLERVQRKNRGINSTLGRRWNSAPGGGDGSDSGGRGFLPIDKANWKQGNCTNSNGNGANDDDDDDDDESYNPYKRTRPHRAKSRRRSYAVYDRAGDDDEQAVKEVVDYGQQDMVEYERPNKRYNNNNNNIAKRRASSYRPPAPRGGGYGNNEEEEAEEPDDYESRLADVLIDLQDPSSHRRRGEREEYGRAGGDDGDEGRPPLPPHHNHHHHRQYQGGAGRYSSAPLPKMGGRTAGQMEMHPEEVVEKEGGTVFTQIQQLAHLISALGNRSNDGSGQQLDPTLPLPLTNNNSFYPSVSYPQQAALSELELALARFSNAPAVAAATTTNNNNNSYAMPQLQNPSNKLSLTEAMALPKALRQSMLADLLDQQHELQSQIHTLREADRLLNPLNATAHRGNGGTGGGMMCHTIPRGGVRNDPLSMEGDEAVVYQQQEGEGGGGGGGGGGEEQGGEQHIPGSLQGAAAAAATSNGVRRELKNPFFVQNTGGGKKMEPSDDDKMADGGNTVGDDSMVPTQQKSATSVMDAAPFASDPPGEGVLPSEHDQQQLMAMLLNQLLRVQGGQQQQQG